MCGPGPDKQGPTYDQVVQADINEQMWDYYQKNYKPLVVQYSKNVSDPVTLDRETKQVAGKINADVMKLAKPVSPTSSIANQKNIMDVADVNANSQITGKAAAKMRQMGKMQNVINIGRGQTTKAMAGLDELASMSVDAAIRDKERDQRSEAVTENAIGSTIGAVAGMGASIAGASLNKGKSRTKSGALIYGSPEYNELADKFL